MLSVHLRISIKTFFSRTRRHQDFKTLIDRKKLFAYFTPVRNMKVNENYYGETLLCFQGKAIKRLNLASSQQYI